MKNVNQLKRFKIWSIFFALISIINVFSCSSDNGDENQDPENTVDLSVISGKYVGLWSWEPGTGPISLIITSENGEGNYKVEYYESNNFTPKNNSDGITPEARGTLEIDGTTATIDLKYNTDNPQCFGDFIGTGKRTEDGVLDLIMNIKDCNADAPATWNLIKTENL